MKLTVLGTSSGFPDTGRHFSGYLIESAETILLMDAGDGQVRQLIKYGVNPLQIDAIIISHTHPDHAAGIFSILQWMHLEKRTEPLQLHLPEGIKDKFIECLCFFHLYPEHLNFAIIYKAIQNQRKIMIHDITICPIKNHHLNNKQDLAKKHGMQANGFSLTIKEQNQNNLFYTSDIDSLNFLDNLHENIDIFLCEATHIKADEIITFAQDKNIKKTLLTHIPKENEYEIAKAIQSFQSMHMLQDGEVLNI